MNDDFYIGYNPAAPPELGRYVRRVVIGVAFLAVAVCLITLLFQSRYVAKTFEFGVVKPWTGVIAKVPYPALITTDGASYLLVGPGKHGFKSEGPAGQTVRLEGTRIEYGPNRMLEVMSQPEPVSMTVNVSFSLPSKPEPVTLSGEIVDTKCHFGVMQPGSGKVHRACAARCIAGGIPPGLLVRNADGSVLTVLLAGADGRELHGEVLPYVAEPVQIRGTLIHSAGLPVLRAEVSDITRSR